MKPAGGTISALTMAVILLMASIQPAGAPREGNELIPGGSPEDPMDREWHMLKPLGILRKIWILYGDIKHLSQNIHIFCRTSCFGIFWDVEI